MDASHSSAFPVSREHSGQNGITKREFFAAVALHGLLSGSPEAQVAVAKINMSLADFSVDLADNLIQVLETK